LTDIFKTGKEVLDQKSIISLLPETTKASIRNVLKIMDNLILSPSSMKNPLFLKDYTSNLGLLLESGLMKILQEKRETKNSLPAENLKGALIKLSEELQDLMKKSGSLAPEDLQKLTQLHKFTEASVKAIETQQMVNIIYQESDGKYVLQIPLLFPEGIKKGEIFIEMENSKGKEGGKNPRHVVMFLSMDALGDIMVDTSIMGKKLGCLFKFDTPEAQAYFSSFLDGLRAALGSLGYDCEYMKCMSDENLATQSEEYRRELFDDRDAVNLFA
ncbi:MAG: hypothetical protein L7F78_03870, partial [Syntrophales bacterium LBB04]|nr:hypothetical protein [Syntrophales bacterium LBB04]